MSNRLTKGIFGFETDYKKTPLGLVNNQMRSDAVVCNAGWYNANGERLGCGDLSMKDISNISKKLMGDEKFFVMTEADSTWDLPKTLDRSAPGVDYLAKNMCWVIIPGGAIKISDVKEATKETKDNILYLKAPRKTVVENIFSKPKPKKPSIADLTPEQLELVKKELEQIKLKYTKSVTGVAPALAVPKIKKPIGAIPIPPIPAPVLKPKVPSLPVPKKAPLKAPAIKKAP